LDDSDVVSFCYNAQGQQVYKKDQSGNVIQMNFDDAGRTTQERVTTCAGGFDDDVLRIATTYDDLGRRDTVVQYDNATAGSGTAQDGVAFTYDDWGNLEMYEEDRNSAVSTGNDEYTVSYTFEQKTTGRNTVRRDTMTLPSGAVIDYNYRVQPARFDDDASRVTYLEHGATAVAEYQYNGLGQVIETKCAESKVKWSQYGSTSGDYPDLDRFNRVTSSRWTSYNGTATDFYDVDISYDRNSNITVVEDNVHTGWDVDYTIDDVDRLTRAEEGTWGGSSISSRTRDEQWTLDQVGNWDVDKVDLNGDGDFVDAGELNDDRTHNDVNELTARDVDDDSSDDYTLSYNAAGCMTDDEENYKYVWDAFLRLREVYNQSDELVAEHRYNGLGHRIGELVDTDTDGDVDGSDEWRYFAHDERWRSVAHFMGSDTDPTEEYLFHAAGLDGSGVSSYLDLVVLRERDTDDNGSMEERVYYCQNWRADVSAIVDNSGVMQEWVKYSSYGVPFGLPAGDTDCDGDCDATDATQIATWSGSSYDVRGDINLDGTVDASDEALVQSATLGRGNLSSIENRLGYAGYVWADSSEEYSVRHRVLSPGLGRWLSRDPLVYVDGACLYQYSTSSPVSYWDARGLCPFSIISLLLNTVCGACQAKVEIENNYSSGDLCWARIDLVQTLAQSKLCLWQPQDSGGSGGTTTAECKPTGSCRMQAEVRLHSNCEGLWDDGNYASKVSQEEAKSGEIGGSTPLWLVDCGGEKDQHVMYTMEDLFGSWTFDATIKFKCSNCQGEFQATDM